MTMKDRTNELKKIIQLKHEKSPNGIFPLKQSTDESKSKFMSTVESFFNSISVIRIKLEKLHSLCKSETLFNNKSNEINELVAFIYQDINSLKDKLSKISSLMKHHQIHTYNEQDKNHKNLILISLETQLAKLSKNFKQMLEDRNKNYQKLQQRKDLITQGGYKKSNTLLNPSIDSFNNNPAISGSIINYQDESGEFSLNFEDQPIYETTQQQIQSQNFDYMKSRASSMQNIESTIVELGDIFSQLAHIVQEQEETIQRIDVNIQSAEMNVEAAHSELLKYLSNISSNRWMMIKIFGILLVFFIIFALVR